MDFYYNALGAFLLDVPVLTGADSPFEPAHAILGAQWLSGRMLDSRPRGRGFEPHRRHCNVFLSKNINPSLVLVQPRKTRQFITEIMFMGRKVSNQTKQTNMIFGTETKVRVSLGKCADSPEPSLPAHET